MKSIDQSNSWRKLQAHVKYVRSQTLRNMFDTDKERGPNMTLTHDGVYLDYSKNLITDKTLSLLRNLLEEAHVAQAIDDMFSGKHINTTEDRPALHIALRKPRRESLQVNDKDVVADVHSALDRMKAFAESISSGKWRGYSGKRILHVVHIGIGGAEIGPHMARDALSDFADSEITTHFISNVDPANFLDVTKTLNPEETLFIISSKSFTTKETLANAHSAKQWIAQKAGDESAVVKHFVAISTNTEAVSAFGINTDHMFEMWDWVGGRYSFMGPTGLIVMIQVGFENFEKILEGAYSIDEHFRTAAPEQNIPITLALISTWYNNFLHAETELFVPYSAKLDRFTTYFQQANMESNGKSVTKDGEPVTMNTGPVVWGRPGTDAQHTFMQHVHQGTRLVPTDILMFKKPFQDSNGQHTLLVANAMAQAKALAFGKTDEELRAEGIDDKTIPHKRMPGNHPSNTLTLPQLTPYTFGQLIALYEHKIFVQGTLWNINSFDQYGVQLGKELAEAVLNKTQ